MAATVHHFGDPSSKRLFPDLSIESRLLIDHLSVQPQGTDVKYEVLEAIIGMPITGKDRSGYHHLTTARRVLMRDKGIVVDVNPGVGVHICTESEKINVSERDLMRSHRASRNARKKLTAVEYQALSEDEKKRWNSRMSVVAVLDLFSGKRALERITSTIEDHPLPAAKTLELFRK
jgi:hypothetical protein